MKSSIIQTYTIVQTAPAVRAALGEEFGLPIGTEVEGKMPTALRAIGFDKVFDTDTGADFTIMEEANELIERIQNGGVMPMMTSCCPAWIRFAEKNFPDQLDHISSCKSPHEMFGAILKLYLQLIPYSDSLNEFHLVHLYIQRFPLHFCFWVLLYHLLIALFFHRLFVFLLSY